jgi:hypothetical protein
MISIASVNRHTEVGGNRMNQNMKNEIIQSIKDFRLPVYKEIPDTGLYLEQVTQYISEFMKPLEDISITSSMISNYVKKKMIDNPVKKQYHREQIAYLIFVVIAKNVLSLEDIHLLFELQKKVYTSETGYNYFCTEFENILQFVFGAKDTIDEVGVDHTYEKLLLRNTIITTTHKIYLDKWFSRVRSME